MKKGFLNKRKYYACNHMNENIFSYNNHVEEEADADDTFGRIQPSRWDERSKDDAEYLADFNFFNRFHDDFDDQDFF
nr:hypothetical protein [Tanacetum cinerariifolium]